MRNGKYFLHVGLVNSLEYYRTWYMNLFPVD